MTRSLPARIGWGLLLALGPVLAALWAGGTTIPGSSFEPWDPNMIDLDVYRRTGEWVLQGKDFYAAGPYLPWIYPPFAALLTVPVFLAAQTVAEVGWLVLNAVVLMAILYRSGLSGWRLSVSATAVIWLVQPVRETLGFGQLAILLVGAAVLDSMPGPRVFGRRLLPEGWLVGIAAAVKLTPAIVAAYNFFAGKRREGLVAFATFCASTAVGFALLWGPSLDYWGRLISGDSGINSGILYKTNQSVLGVWTRMFGESSRGGLVAALLVIVLGLVAAVLLHRIGEVSLAICVAGLAGLLGSPISWSHHYVWIVPLGVLLLRRADLPQYLRVTGLFYAIWVAFAPFGQLPGGDQLELTYPPLHAIVDNVGVFAGVALLGCGLAAAIGSWGRSRRDAEPAVR